MDDLKKKIRIYGVKNGLLLGIAVVLLTIISFYFITGFTKSPLLFIAAPITLRVLIPIAIVVALCFRMRTQIGGLWTFKQATTGIFIIFVTAYFINIIGIDIVFYKFVEPDSAQKTQTAAINMKTNLMKTTGAGQKDIDAAIVDMKKDMSPNKDGSVVNILMGYGFVILFLFVFALIFSALLRNAEYAPAAKQ